MLWKYGNGFLTEKDVQLWMRDSRSEGKRWIKKLNATMKGAMNGLMKGNNHAGKWKDKRKG